MKKILSSLSFLIILCLAASDAFAAETFWDDPLCYIGEDRGLRFVQDNADRSEVVIERSDDIYAKLRDRLEVGTCYLIERHPTQYTTLALRAVAKFVPTDDTLLTFPSELTIVSSSDGDYGPGGGGGIGDGGGGIKDDEPDIEISDGGWHEEWGDDWFKSAPFMEGCLLHYNQDQCSQGGPASEIHKEECDEDNPDELIETVLVGGVKCSKWYGTIWEDCPELCKAGDHTDGTCEVSDDICSLPNGPEDSAKCVCSDCGNGIIELDEECDEGPGGGQSQDCDGVCFGPGWCTDECKCVCVEPPRQL